MTERGATDQQKAITRRVQRGAFGETPPMKIREFRYVTVAFGGLDQSAVWVDSTSLPLDDVGRGKALRRAQQCVRFRDAECER